MHAFQVKDTQIAALVGLGARVLMLAAEPDAGLHRQIAGLGGQIDHEPEMYAALSALMDDPAGWDLFVIACDPLGGLDRGFCAHRMLGAVAERVPTILISAECRTQEFPDDRRAPITLRGPASAVSLRVGMEHALRGKLGWRLG